MNIFEPSLRVTFCWLHIYVQFYYLHYISQITHKKNMIIHLTVYVLYMYYFS